MLLICTACTVGIAHARGDQSHIYTHNQSDTGVWVTVYSGQREYTDVSHGQYRFVYTNRGAWCVGPGKTDEHGLSAQILHVRFEITKTTNCAHPVLIDNTQEYAPDAFEEHYQVGGSKGTYTISKGTP